MVRLKRGATATIKFNKTITETVDKLIITIADRRNNKKTFKNPTLVNNVYQIDISQNDLLDFSVGLLQIEGQYILGDKSYMTTRDTAMLLEALAYERVEGLGGQDELLNLEVMNYSSGSGTSDHAALKNLDFESSKHTGFQKELTTEQLENLNNPFKPTAKQLDNINNAFIPTAEQLENIENPFIPTEAQLEVLNNPFELSAPTETALGGITAKARTTESQEVAFDPETNRLYVAAELSEKINAQIDPTIALVNNESLTLTGISTAVTVSSITGKGTFTTSVVSDDGLEITLPINAIKSENYPSLFLTGYKYKIGYDNSLVWLESEIQVEERNVIQFIFDQSAEKGIVANIPNLKGDRVYKITTNIIIPDGLHIEGNGATILIESVSGATGDAWTVLAEGVAVYREFAILPNSAVPSGAQQYSFSINNLNFKIESHQENSNLPTTILGIIDCKGVNITNCNFEAYSDVRKFHTLFDAYDGWEDVFIKNCNFIHETDGVEGGVWIRNFYGNTTCKNAVVEDCYFTKKAGDEIIAIWGNGAGWIENVVIKNCNMIQKKSEFNNPDHLVTLGWQTRNLKFVNNNIFAETVTNTLVNFSLRSSDETKNVAENTIIENNTFICLDVLETSNPYFYGDKIERKITFNNNYCHLNTSDLKKDFAIGTTLQCNNNIINGNGIGTLLVGVGEFSDNIVEECNQLANGIKTFKNNIIKNIVSDTMMRISTDFLNGTEKRPIDIELINNNILTSGTGNVYTTSITPAYINLVFENNVFKKFRLQSSNADYSVVFNDSIIMLDDFDDLIISSKCDYGIFNQYIKSDGTALVIATAAPTGNSFNNSINVGSRVLINALFPDEIKPVTSFEELLLDNFIDSDIVGWRKIADGTAPSTWLSITKKELVNYINRNNSNHYSVSATMATNGLTLANGDNVEVLGTAGNISVISVTGEAKLSFAAGTTIFVLPNGTGWANDTEPTFTTGKFYNIEIKNGTFYSDGGRTI